MSRPVHLLVEIPEKTDVSSFLWWLKERSSLIIYEKYPELSETGIFGAEDIMWKRRDVYKRQAGNPVYLDRHRHRRAWAAGF